MSQEIINHLSELGRLTNNPKYYVDIADIFAASPYIENKDKAIEIYSSSMNSYDLYHKFFTDSYIKNAISNILNYSDISSENKYFDTVTVIIPTLWKADLKYFRKIMGELSACDQVKEVIIIDNNPEARFDLCWEAWNNVKFVDDGVDRKVNPAWNKGLSLTKTKYYLLLNDDCLIDEYLIRDSINILESHSNIGLINYHTKDIDPYAYANRGVKPQASYVNNIGNYLGGWCMCGRTEDYKPIPESLKIFFGDNYIHHNVKKSGKRVVQLISGFVSHALSKTVCSENIYSKGYLGTEGLIYQEILMNENPKI